MDWDVLVAGGGPAGMTAGIYGARAGLKTAIVDPLGGGGQASTADVIRNYPGFPKGIAGAELMDLMAEQAKTFGAEIVFDTVTSVSKELEGFTVRSSRKSISVRSVIWAAGTSPKRLGVPGEDKFIGKGISFCATCDGALFRDKTVAVVGGGDSALTEAEFLTRFTTTVYLIHRRDEFRAGLASVRRIEGNPKIRRIMSGAVVEVLGGDKVRAIRVKDLKSGSVTEISVDGVFLYVGSQPNVEPIKDLVDTNQSGYVRTELNMATKTPGLFAAGDIRDKKLRQVTTAVADGAIAAWSAERYLLESEGGSGRPGTEATASRPSQSSAPSTSPEWSGRS